MAGVGVVEMRGAGWRGRDKSHLDSGTGVGGGHSVEEIG